MKTDDLKSFTEFANLVIDGFCEEGKYSTAHLYQCALNSYQRYLDADECLFGDLTRSLLSGYETYLRMLGRSWNTVSSYLRALRAIYNRAVDAGWIDGIYRLFSGLYMGVDRPGEHAVDADTLRELTDEKNVEGQPERVVRAQGVLRLMVLLSGIPFVDLAHLKKSDLKNGVLRCHRRKTRAALCVTLLPEALELIDRFRNHDPASPYLLDFLQGCSEDEADYREYGNLLRRLNHDLGALARCCGVSAAVSSYTARHSWATIAKRCGVPVAVISQALGHSSIRTTEIYLSAFDKECTNKANKLTNKCIKTGKIVFGKFK